MSCRTKISYEILDCDHDQDRGAERGGAAGRALIVTCYDEEKAVV